MSSPPVGKHSTNFSIRIEAQGTSVVYRAEGKRWDGLMLRLMGELGLLIAPPVS